MENLLNYKENNEDSLFVISLTYKLSSGGSKNFRTEGAVEFFGSDIPYDFIEIEVDCKR